jgi:FMN hydrolase / 5-amino-6-(5-phospho-D-ribitylamino)uracil phosphatase
MGAKSQAKPDPRIFKAAAAAVGVNVANVLHIGDDSGLDAVGALQSGMHACRLAQPRRQGLAARAARAASPVAAARQKLG